MSLNMTFDELRECSRELRAYVMLNDYINDFLREAEAKGAFSREERLFLLKCLEPLAVGQEVLPKVVFFQMVNESESNPAFPQHWQTAFNRCPQPDELKVPFVQAMKHFNRDCQRVKVLLRYWTILMATAWYMRCAHAPRVATHV